MVLDRSDKPRLEAKPLGAALTYERTPDTPQPKAQKVHPLWLPAGSIRALLTLLIVGVVVVQTARLKPPGLLWVETLMFALAHYFTSRRTFELTPETKRILESCGEIEDESQPLYLPRHSVRTLIIAAFVGLAVYLYQNGRLNYPNFDREAVSILVIFFAYMLGVVGKVFGRWWRKLADFEGVSWWQHLKAGVTVLLTAIVAACFFLDRPDLVPADVQNFTLGLVLFYFGSR